MGRYEHYKEIAITNILNEMDREHVNNHDSRIDPSKTKENVVLQSPNCPATTADMRRYIHDRLDSLGSKPKKTTSVLGQWIFTLPEEMKGLPKDDKVEFFRMIYGKVQERYGSENVLPAFIHFDEPAAGDHIQIPVIPVARAGTRFKSTEYDKEATETARAAGWTGKQKTKRIWKTYEHDTLNNAAVMTKHELSSIHRALDREIYKNHPEWAKFGMSEDGAWRGLLNNGRTKGKYTKEEFKQRMKDEQRRREEWDRIEQAETAVQNDSAELREWEDELDKREDAVKQREQAVSASEAQIRVRDRQSKENLQSTSNALNEAERTCGMLDQMYDDAGGSNGICQKWMDTPYRNSSGGIYTPRQMYDKWAKKQQEPIRTQQKAVQSQLARVRLKSASERAEAAAEDILQRDAEQGRNDWTYGI